MAKALRAHSHSDGFWGPWWWGCRGPPALLFSHGGNSCPRGFLFVLTFAGLEVGWSRKMLPTLIRVAILCLCAPLGYCSFFIVFQSYFSLWIVVKSLFLREDVCWDHYSYTLLTWLSTCLYFDWKKWSQHIHSSAPGTICFLCFRELSREVSTHHSLFLLSLLSVLPFSLPLFCSFLLPTQKEKFWCFCPSYFTESEGKKLKNCTIF